jgi:hypothetical protein
VEKDRRPGLRAARFWAGANAEGIPLQAIVATAKKPAISSSKRT